MFIVRLVNVINLFVVIYNLLMTNISDQMRYKLDSKFEYKNLSQLALFFCLLLFFLFREKKKEGNN